MSLAINKFADGGSPEVRTYKRGNDEINFNDFIRQAEYGFNNWLDQTDLKDKYKSEVRAAYQDIINRMNQDPNSFTARLGGGFTNTAGITNKTDGFDAYGIAAGYLGNTLRGMPVYTKPEVKSDKTKYKRDGKLINSTIQSYIIGDNPDNFIFLDNDSFDEATGQRGMTHRIEQTLTGLEWLKGRLKDYYDFDSEDEHKLAIDKINKAIGILKNGNPNDDWFVLGQLGFTNVDKYFLTGKEKRTTPLSQEEQTQIESSGAAQQFEDWMSTNRPFYSGSLDSIPLTETGNASEEDKQELLNTFRSLTDNQITHILGGFITHPEGNFTSHQDILSLGKILKKDKFTSHQVISGVIYWAIQRGLGKQLTDNVYYFPFTKSDRQDGSSTVYVYDTSDHTIKEIDAQYVPEYRNEYLNAYKQSNPSSSIRNPKYSELYSDTGLYPSKKKGGVLKAESGTKTEESNKIKFNPPELTTPPITDGIPGLSPDWAKLQYGYKDEGKGIIWGADDELPYWKGKRHDLRKPAIGTEPHTPSIREAYRIQRNYIKSGNIVKDVQAAYKKWSENKDNQGKTYKDFVNYYNAKVDNIRNLGTTRFQKGYGATGFSPLYDDFNELYSSNASVDTPNYEKGLLGKQYNLRDINGSTMSLRNALAFYNDDDSKDLRLGTFIANDPSKVQFWVDNKGHLELREPKQSQQVDTDKDTTKKDTDKKGAADPSILDETQTKLQSPDVKANLNKQGVWDNLGPDLLGAGRLAMSIRANNRIARAVRESLRPKLHNTYELYSPVTGAFSEMQLRNRQGADLLSQSYRPFTSDASSAVARMYEGQSKAYELQHLGFLADDKEIRRTQAEALKKQENNRARWTAVGNENTDSIISNNQDIAQLEASRLKQNWSSQDAYNQGIESRWRQDIAEKNDRSNQFALSVASDEIEDFRKNAMNQLRDKYKQWQAADPEDRKDSTFTDWATLNYDSYSRAVQDISAYARALSRKRYAEIYGESYSWPTQKNSNGVETPLEFNINSGRYKWARNGGTLTPRPTINKIRRKNEGNS